MGAAARCDEAGWGTGDAACTWEATQNGAAVGTRHGVAEANANADTAKESGEEAVAIEHAQESDRGGRMKAVGDEQRVEEHGDMVKNA